MSQGHFPFAVDRFVQKQAAKNLTRPFWDEMTSVWTNAWKEWGKIDEQQRARPSETTNVPPINVWSFAQHFAKQTFSNRENEGIVVCTELPGLFAFYIQDKVLVRFNALSPEYVVQNCFGASERREQYFR